MTVLEIEGVGKVEVGESFLSLSPEDQQKTVNEIAASAKGGQPQAPDTGGGLPVQATSGFNEGLSQIFGLPVDIMNGALGAVGVPVSDKPFLGSEQVQSVARDIGLISPPSEQPGAAAVRRIGQEVGASALPAVGVVGAAARGARTAKPIVGELLEMASKNPGTFAATETSLAATSGVGAAVANDVAPGSTPAEIAGQVAGSFSPAAAAGVARGIVRGGPQAGRKMREAIKTFDQAGGATPTVGQSTGSTTRNILERAFAQAPGGMQITQRAAKKQQEAIGDHISRLARGLAPRSDATKAGQTINTGLSGPGGFIERFKTDARGLYGRVSKFIPPDRPVSVRNTLDELEEATASIPGAPNISDELLNQRLARINEKLRTDAGKDGFVPFGALQGLRTRIGEMLASNELIDDVPRGKLKRLYSSLSNDLEAAALSSGPEAASAFRRANKFYKRQIRKVDDFLRPIARKANPEDIFRAATQGRDGATRIGAVRTSLKPKEWNVVASAVLKRMGRARSGAQDDLGEVFSTETFLTNWNNLDDTAKDALFKGVRESQDTLDLRSNLDTVAKAASDIRAGSAALSNPSGTSAAGVNAGTVILGLLGATTGNTQILGGVALTVGGSAVGSLFLTNPRMVKVMAQATRVPATRLPAILARMSVVAKGDPELAEAMQELLSKIQETREDQER